MLNGVVNYVLKNQVLSAIIIVGIAWLMIEIREVLVVLFISYILMAAIEPYVEFLQKRRVPKALAIFIPYFITILILGLLIVSLMPFLIGQISALISVLPRYAVSAAALLGFPLNGSSIQSLATNEFANVSSSVFSVTSKLFGGIFQIISIFVLSFYFLVYRESVQKSFSQLFPVKHQGRVLKTMSLTEDKLGSWLRGQVILSGFIGAGTWIVLIILGVPFALPLAVIAGLLEIVPTIGPTVSAIPAVLVALTISFPLALIVAASYVLVQFFESHVLVPRVMQRAVGLNPIVIIIGIIIGGRLLGPVGALLAVPFISFLVVIAKNLK